MKGSCVFLLVFLCFWLLVSARKQEKSQARILKSSGKYLKGIKDRIKSKTASVEESKKTINNFKHKNHIKFNRKVYKSKKNKRKNIKVEKKTKIRGKNKSNRKSKQKQKKNKQNRVEEDACQDKLFKYLRILQNSGAQASRIERHRTITGEYISIQCFQCCLN